MPWCDACDRFLSPSTVRADGTCPTCGGAVDPGRAHAVSPPPAVEAGERDQTTAGSDAAGEDDEDLPPVPWHLKALGAALVIYLGYRAFQGIEWILGK